MEKHELQHILKLCKHVGSLVTITQPPYNLQPGHSVISLYHEHWVLVYNDGTQRIYFDSLAGTCPELKYDQAIIKRAIQKRPNTCGLFTVVAGILLSYGFNPTLLTKLSEQNIAVILSHYVDAHG